MDATAKPCCRDGTCPESNPFARVPRRMDQRRPTATERAVQPAHPAASVLSPQPPPLRAGGEAPVQATPGSDGSSLCAVKSPSFSVDGIGSSADVTTPADPPSASSHAASSQMRQPWPSSKRKATVIDPPGSAESLHMVRSPESVEADPSPDGAMSGERQLFGEARLAGTDTLAGSATPMARLPLYSPQSAASSLHNVRSPEWWPPAPASAKTPAERGASSAAAQPVPPAPAVSTSTPAAAASEPPPVNTIPTCWSMAQDDIPSKA